MSGLISVHRIESRIYHVRGKKIMLKEVVTICDHLHKLKFSPYLPLAFTEQGVAMLSSVLNSERAIQVNIQIIKTFIKLREMLLTHAELKRKIEEMEGKYDQQFQVVFDAIRQLLTPSEKPRRRIGFHPHED